MLTVYTRDFGTLRLVARGLRRPNSRLAGHLEPLVHASLQLARGRGPDIVTGADTLHGHTALRNSLEGIARGLVCAELVEAFAPEEQANPELFHLLLHAIAMLNEGEEDRLLWHFAFHVLRLTGYMPELQQCVVCGAAGAAGPAPLHAGTRGRRLPPLRSRRRPRRSAGTRGVAAAAALGERAQGAALLSRPPVRGRAPPSHRRRADAGAGARRGWLHSLPAGARGPQRGVPQPAEPTCCPLRG